MMFSQSKLNRVKVDTATRVSRSYSCNVPSFSCNVPCFSCNGNVNM